jgi:hypothetical protein
MLKALALWLRMTLGPSLGFVLRCESIHRPTIGKPAQTYIIGPMMETDDGTVGDAVMARPYAVPRFHQ